MSEGRERRETRPFRVGISCPKESGSFVVWFDALLLRFLPAK